MRQTLDHGANSLKGGICFNEWLIKNGYLTLKSYPKTSTPIAKAEIDWSKTKAWGDGGYYGRLFMNVRGREPQGTVDKADYEKVRDEIVAGIAEIADPKGAVIGSKAFRRPKVRPAPAPQLGRRPREPVPVWSAPKSYKASGNPVCSEMIGLMDQLPTTALATEFMLLPNFLPLPNGRSYTA